MEESKQIIVKNEEQLFYAISRLIDESRRQVAKAVNTAMVYTYYSVGQYIVEFEQGGKVRAAYGKEVLKRLSARLTEKYGKGWSEDNLENCRNLFLNYSITEPVVRKLNQETISEPVVRKLNQETISEPVVRKLNQETISEPAVRKSDQEINSEPVARNTHTFLLPWTHYLILMRVKNLQARKFYEIEAYNQQWSKRQLQRQIASSLYERLALSRDKDEVMRLANEGQVVEKTSDIIKNPLVLEFLGLKPDTAYSETDLETAILDKLESFLLECGKGFLFEARQKRFTFDEDNFYVDLVLYNRILQCYVLVDLKIDKLTHQDLGQMMMYVNYFDRYKRLEFEKPTIGILLCKDKNDALVELTLPKDANIYAQQYALCLPKKEELQRKLKEWIREYEDNTDTSDSKE